MDKKALNEIVYEINEENCLGFSSYVEIEEAAPAEIIDDIMYRYIIICDGSNVDDKYFIKLDGYYWAICSRRDEEYGTCLKIAIETEKKK